MLTSQLLLGIAVQIAVLVVECCLAINDVCIDQYKRGRDYTHRRLRSRGCGCCSTLLSVFYHDSPIKQIFVTDTRFAYSLVHLLFFGFVITSAYIASMMFAYLTMLEMRSCTLTLSAKTRSMQNQFYMVLVAEVGRLEVSTCASR